MSCVVQCVVLCSVVLCDSVLYCGVLCLCCVVVLYDAMQGCVAQCSTVRCYTTLCDTACAAKAMVRLAAQNNPARAGGVVRGCHSSTVSADRERN